ncbi:MAG: hypothetical protein ACREA3_07860 [Nitrosotalea sp.]
MKTLHISIIIGLISSVIIGVTIFTVFSTRIDVIGLQDTYNAGQQVKFKLEAKGYGIPCTSPDITIYKTDQPSVILFEIKFPPYMCPIGEPFFYTMDYPGKNDTYSTTIKQPGSYTLHASFLNKEIKREFRVK